MQYVINHKERFDSSLAYILDKLPQSISEKISMFLENNKIYTINEIRIKALSTVSLIYNQNNLSTNIFIDERDMNEIILKLCEGSIYAHIPTIKEGYINVGKGLRAGVCGKAILTNGQIEGIYNISSINIRLPQKINHAGEFVFNLIKEMAFQGSILIYSPPGIGKTTILRDLIVRLSNNTAIRYSVIDSREEITPFLNEKITGDIFLTYPKGLAIEIATKSMTPELIICDEITSKDEVNSILCSVNTGVSFIATAHAGSFEELCSKVILSPLFSSKVFDIAVGIKRNKQNKFEYKIDRLKWKLSEAHL